MFKILMLKNTQTHANSMKLDTLFFPPPTESIYRRGARRWRKLYYAGGHAFQAKRFNRVRQCSTLYCNAYCEAVCFFRFFKYLYVLQGMLKECLNIQKTHM